MSEIRLPDGRRLTWAEHGDPAGRPVLACHGNPGSRLAWAPLPESDLRGIRLIAPDRPGFGGSDGRSPGHGEWPADVGALADHLQIDRFAVVGVSGGGPYAIGCAWRFPDRVTGLGLIGTGPVTADVLHRSPLVVRGFFLAARRAPALLRWRARRMAALARRDPEQLVRRTFASFPDADREMLGRADVLSHLAGDFAEAFRQGGDASGAELARYARSWVVPPTEVTAPTVIWHGEEDTVVDPACAAHLAARLPNAELRRLDGAGHLGYLDRVGELLREIA